MPLAPAVLWMDPWLQHHPAEHRGWVQAPCWWQNATKVVQRSCTAQGAAVHVHRPCSSMGRFRTPLCAASWLDAGHPLGELCTVRASEAENMKINEQNRNKTTQQRGGPGGDAAASLPVDLSGGRALARSCRQNSPKSPGDTKPIRAGGAEQILHGMQPGRALTVTAGRVRGRRGRAPVPQPAVPRGPRPAGRQPPSIRREQPCWGRGQWAPAGVGAGQCGRASAQARNKSSLAP